MRVSLVRKMLLSKQNLLKMGNKFVQSLPIHALLKDIVMMGLANVIYHS